MYFYLQIGGPETIDKLQATLGLERETLYTLLETLIAKDLVIRSGEKYTCRDQYSTWEAS